MSIAYQYDANGYYAGESEDYGLLPNNATYEAPEKREGFISKWNGSGWELIENHKGWEGWLNGERFIMRKYGPLPEGATKEAPEPSAQKKAEQIRAKRDGLISSTDYLMMPDYPSLGEEYRAALTAYRQDLRDIPAQPGFPFEVIWPDKPELS